MSYIQLSATCGYDGAGQLLVFAVEQVVQLPVHTLGPGEGASWLLDGSGHKVNIKSYFQVAFHYMHSKQNSLLLVCAQYEILGERVVHGGQPHDVPHVLRGGHRDQMYLCI